jgi:hypothetical protein
LPVHIVAEQVPMVVDAREVIRANVPRLPLLFSKVPVVKLQGPPLMQCPGNDSKCVQVAVLGSEGPERKAP